MKHRLLSILLVLALLASLPELSDYVNAASSPSPDMGSYEFETAIYGKGLDGSDSSLYPEPKRMFNYQYLTVNAVNTYTNLWISPETSLSFENVGEAHCIYHCFSTTKACPAEDALEHASYRTMSKIIHGDASFFPDISGQNFVLDFSGIPERLMLDDITVKASIHIGGTIHTFSLPEDEITRLANAVKNRTRYSYFAGEDIYFMNLDVKITGAYSDYTVYTLDTCGGQSGTGSLVVRYNHTLKDLPIPERNGYTFTGWFTAPKGGTQILPSHTNASETNQTLYAQWAPKAYHVTCIDKSTTGKELGTTHSTAPYESTLSGSQFGSQSHPNAYYKGYRYTSCSSAKTGLNGCTVYRYFTPLSVTVSLDAAGGNLTSKEFSATYDTPLSQLPTPSRTGYRFDGWVTDTDEPVCATDLSPFTENTLLHARWFPDTCTPYTVEIRKKNLASVYETTASFQRYGTTDSTVSVSPDDYSYEGFHYAPQDSLPSHCLNADGSLLLHLNYERNQHKVIFDMNTAQVTSCSGISIPEAPDAIDAFYGETVLLPEPTENITGYTFGGWSHNPHATQAVYDSGKTMVMADASCRLYAVWIPRQDTRYTVCRFQKERSGEYRLLSRTELTGCTDAMTSYTDTEIPEGYHINHTVSRLNGRILPDGSLTLVVKYEPVLYEVSFLSAYDKDNGIRSHTYQYGDSFVLPEASYQRSGYVQTGWTDIPSQEAAGDATPRFSFGERITVEQCDLHFYPTWKSLCTPSPAAPSVSAVPQANQTPLPSLTPEQTPPRQTESPDSSSDLLSVRNRTAVLSAKKAKLGIGERFCLSLSDGKISSVTYSEKYVDVQKKGNRKIQIQARKKGTTTVSVKTADGQTHTCKITIKKAPKKIQTTKKEIRLKRGRKKQIRMKLPKGSACSTYRYRSSAPGIARVSSKGVICASKKGNCRITVTSYNRKKAHLQVQVR